MDKELRILMIEDVPHDAELEIRELKRAGMRVAHRLVETEGAFREALREFQPEIIISDFSMPHFDGMWALALAREIVPDVPFIFVSGTIGEEYAIRALKDGATDYVLKNNLVRLPAAVERALQEARERAARRQAEEALRESEEKYRLLWETTSDAVILMDEETRIQYANPAVMKVFGYAPEEVTGREIAMLQPERLRQAHRRGVKRYLETGVKTLDWRSTEVIALHRDGHEFPVEISFSHMDVSGKPLFAGSMRDITERKTQELKIARLSRIHAVLSGINSAIVRIRNRQELFEEACRIAVEHGNFGLAWIGVFDPATLDVTPVAWAGLGWGEFNRTKSSARADVPLGQGVVGRAIRERKPMFDNDISANPDVAGKRRQEALQLGYRSLIALPLFAEDAVAGILALFAKEPNFFNEDELKLLTELSGDISFALEHMARQQKLEKLSRIRAVSSEINAAIVRIREREALFKETCRIASEQGKFELVWIGALDPEKQEVKPIAWTGFSPEAAHAVSWASISAARGTLGEAIQTRKAAVRNDIEVELPGGKLRQEALKKGCRSTVCLPLVVDDNVVALIVLFAAGRGFFDEDELALLNELAADVSFALQSIARQEKLEYLSYYDALTGLPNRHLFIDRLAQQMRSRSGEPRMVALILLDLERFRNINETLGRHGGDELLKRVAQRLEHAFHGRDYLARIGADGFGVVIRGVRDAASVAHTIENQALSCFSEPFILNGKDLRVAAKAGVALFPADGGDADTLFKNAEAALRNAKASGERYLFYAPQMNARVAEKLKLENELRAALREEQFILHYQPRVELASGRVCGLEALIRWVTPDRGLVPPAEFIPLLEETGMILEVGRWALKRATADYAAWRAKGLTPPRIAVNVSAIQLHQKDFVESVRTAVAAGGGYADCIDIELTESMVMGDVEGNIRKLGEIRAAGMQIAIDDFGTGYSSLSYLARLPLDALKIDRSFIVHMATQPDQMAIVSAVISLAHSLNLKVTAEGVETEEQRNLLKLLKCDEMQGYLFSRPLPVAEVEAKFLGAAAAT